MYTFSQSLNNSPASYFRSGYATIASTLLLAALTACGGGGGGSSSTSGSSSQPVTPATYSVGGTVTGLQSGEQITIENNAANPTVISANAAFTFSAPISSGGTYAISISQQPVTQTCTVTNGSMTNVTANVSNIAINCATAGYAVLYAFGAVSNDAINPINGNLVQGSDSNFYGVTYQGGSGAEGAVIKLTPAGVETILHPFTTSGTEGYAPYGAGLTLGSDGNFYGTTAFGAAHNCGAAFKVTPGGTVTTLYAFGTNSGDGCSPYSGITQGSDGNFYGLTNAGGSAGYGVIYRIATDGTEVVLHTFTGGATDGRMPQFANLVQASDSNFYGVTVLGGVSNQGIVFKITPGGTFTLLHSFDGSTEGGNSSSALSVGPDGQLYGNTNVGGASNQGTVFKISTTGTFTLLHTFAGGTTDGAAPLGSNMVLGADNNFYSMTVNGGLQGDGVIYKMTPDGTVTLLHSFAGGTADGYGPESGLTIGADGYLYGTALSGGANSDGIFFRY